MNTQEQYFGLSLCMSRTVIHALLGVLKARFRALCRAMDIHMDDLTFVIYACFVLHNFCETETVPEKNAGQLCNITETINHLLILITSKQTAMKLRPEE